MTIQQTTFVAPPRLAIADGATTPDPGGADASGASVWSTTTNSLLIWTGTAWAALAGGSPGENPVTYDAGDSGSAITINCANGWKQSVRLTAATPVITITNLNTVSKLRLALRQDGTGGRVPSFVIAGRTLLYQGGGVPPFSTSANARDVRQFVDDAVSSVVDVDAGIGYAAP